MRSVIHTKNSRFLSVNGLGKGDGTIMLKYILFFSNMNPIIAITKTMYSSSRNNGRIRRFA